MTMRNMILLGAALAFTATSATADTIAYWAQNDNTLDPTGFGFETGDFPQAADVGSGDLTWTGDLSDTAGVLNTVQSFAGNSLNALPGFGSGGSISPQNGTAGLNNGASIWLSVDTTDYSDIMVSWAQRGTATGFASREFSYSIDGGTNFTSVGTDVGGLTSTWALESYDLSGVTAVEGTPVIFAITLDNGDVGSDSGNNRFDNLLVSGTFVPEPGTAVLALLSLAAAGAGSMRKRLG